MITVTHQQMVDYCFAQPDERLVNFDDAFRNDSCGCVMVHYGLDHGFKFSTCTAWGWVTGPETHACLEYGIVYRNFRPSDRSMYTYGEIKSFLRDKGHKPTEEIENG